MLRRETMLALATTPLVGCAPRIPAALRPAEIPAGSAATFRALQPGQPPLAIEAGDTRWLVSAEPGAGIEPLPHGARINTIPGRRAWASPRLPLIELERAGTASVEELAWDTAISLTARFFIVCELRFAGEPGALLMQATPFDVQVFQDSERPAGGASTSVSRLLGDGRIHSWRIRIDARGLSLRLDGSEVWLMPGARPLARVSFGETRTDSLHGGSMWLRDVVYVRRPA